MGTGSPASCRASTHRATAVFRPEKEKSNRCRCMSRGPVRPRGKSIADRSPSWAARSIGGPPGKGIPSSRATLSNASPAASSIVAPKWFDVPGDVLDHQQRRMTARNQQRDGRLRQRSVLQLVDGDVGSQVVDPVERFTEAYGDRLRRRHPDHQRARQPWPAGDRDGIHVAKLNAGFPTRPLDRGTMASRWARLATSGTTPPNRACSSTELATASASSSRPRTRPTPVSSQDVSIPSTKGWSANTTPMLSRCPRVLEPSTVRRHPLSRTRRSTRASTFPPS